MIFYIAPWRKPGEMVGHTKKALVATLQSVIPCGDLTYGDGIFTSGASPMLYRVFRALARNQIIRNTKSNTIQQFNVSMIK